MLIATLPQVLGLLRGVCLACFVFGCLEPNSSKLYADDEIASATKPGTAADTAWRRLELPPGEIRKLGIRGHGGVVTDAAIEPRGTLWVMANHNVSYWTGSQFAKPKGESLRAGEYLSCFWGGGDRPLYATQPAPASTIEQANRGQIFRLLDGTASYVTDFYYDVAHQHPGIYVAKTGQIINWGESFIAIYDGAEWTRHEADLGRQTALVETNHGFHFLKRNRVFTIDRAGQLQIRELNLPAETLLTRPTLWGVNRLLVYDLQHHKLLAYELPDFKLIELREADRVVSGFRSGTPVRAPDGSVWFQSPLAGAPLQRSLNRLTLDATVELVDNAKLVPWYEPWGSWPEPVLFCKDGTFWLTTQNQGIWRLKGGEVQRYGWREGLAEGGARTIFQDAAENLYAVYHHGIWMLPADGQRSPLPDWTRLWSEHPLAAARPAQDDAQQLWMALASRPTAISCWDGAKFTHHEVPFDTSSLKLLLIDDQQHLLAMLRDPQSFDVVCHDVGPQENASYDSLEEMLVAAVKRGAKKFNSTHDIIGPLVDPQGRIWYAYGHDAPVRMYNGSSWLTLRGYVHVHAAVNGEVLATGSSHIGKYDRGVFVPAPLHPDASHVRMTGPVGILPFEPAIYLAAPQKFLLTSKRNKLLAKAEPNPAGPDKVWQFQVGQARPSYFSQYVTSGRFGSHWSSYCACNLYRLKGGQAILSDFANTPVEGQAYITSNVFDDAAGNLWIHRGSWWDGRNSMFMKDTSQFRLEPLNVPLPIPLKTLHIVTTTDAQGQSVRPNLLWQIDNGVWTRSTQPGELTLEFEQPGKHRIRILGIGPQAEFSREMLDVNFEVIQAEIK